MSEWKEYKLKGWIGLKQDCFYHTTGCDVIAG